MNMANAGTKRFEITQKGASGEKMKLTLKCTMFLFLWMSLLLPVRGHAANAIIKKVLSEQGIAADFKLSKSYEEREYCVQYGESTLHFISRLCEEEGIYYYFEHQCCPAKRPRLTD